VLTPTRLTNTLRKDVVKNLNNTTILDSREAIGKLDEKNMMGSVDALADQVRHAWEACQKVKVSLSEPVHNVVVVGMGGSALGPDVFKHAFKSELTVPFEVYNSYELPAYANKNTLVVLSSYSGTTEEVLFAGKQAEQLGAQIMVIAAGGDLKKLADDKGYPAYIIDPKFNPSNQPRMAIGYAITGLIGMMVQAQLANITDTEIQEVVNTIIQVSEKLRVEVPQQENQAKLLAFQSIERRPIFVASDFLVGAAHVGANQWNENAKIFADYKIIPEINHHLMEGLRFPKSNNDNHVFYFFQSELYSPRVQKRMTLTQAVVEQNKIETMAIKLESETKLTQVFELITLLAYAGFYVSMLEGINPSPIPFVDWFKDELSKA